MITVHQVSALHAPEEASRFLVSQLMKNGSIPVLLLVSGGSALEILHRINFSRFTNLDIGLLDQRIGPPDIRNWESSFVTVPVLQDVLPEAAGRDYDGKLHQWKKNNPQGKVFITQGIGPDGHTAGIITGYEKLCSGPQWAVGYDAKDSNIYRFRVTVTLGFLKNEVDWSLLYVLGEYKKQVFDTIDRVPAGVIKSMKQVDLFTDIENVPL